MALYEKAQWRGPVPNDTPKGMRAYKLGVIHIMQGTLSGTDLWFHNPKAQVSAHFGNGKSGLFYQWVDTSNKAWAEVNYNDLAISVENEGDTGQQLTDNQITNLAHLMVWVKNIHGIPLALATSPNGEGWLGHSTLGIEGGNHPLCPGQPVLAQLPSIIRLAASLDAPEPSPAIPAPPTGFTYLMAHPQGKGEVVANLEKGEWYGLNAATYEHYLKLPGMKSINTVNYFDSMKQIGTL